jgi:prolyl oligopeptidase
LFLIRYPVARCTEAVEECAGVTFPDPYRWLEDGSRGEVRDWQRTQAQLASEYVRRWPHFEAVKRSVGEFYVGRVSVPRVGGQSWFRVAQVKDASSSCVMLADAPTAVGRVLFDPRDLDRDSPPEVSWISPSPDGRVLALGLCGDGSENNTIRLIDVSSGDFLPDPPRQVLMDSWLGGVYWLSDSSGFYYTALSGTTHEFRQAIYFHRIGSPPPSMPEEIPFLPGGHDYVGVMVSRCGRWAVVMQRILTPIPVAIRDLRDPKSAWRPFILQIPDSVAGHALDDCYIAVTTLGAPRGRVIALALDSTTPNDPATWRDIVSESDAVIRSVTPIGEWLYVVELVDTYARVRIFTLDGMQVGEVPLPGRGAIAEMPFTLMELFARRPAEAFVFAFSSLIESWGLYSHKVGSDLARITEPAVRIENAVIEDEWATSADGARVPYHVVRRADLDAQRPQPTLLYGYGASGAPVNPQYPGPIAAFIAAGGVYVHCHLRGGGEFGLDWWRGGVLKNRTNSYADVYAIAEDLIAKGKATPRRLGLTGGSAGGLMAGVALTERPDLWRVVIPRVPVLDVIGGGREPYLRYVASHEYGDLDNPEEVRRIAGFSPYLLVKQGIEYPAVYIDAGDTDPRCPAWHARKFAARLQAAQQGDHPILVHVWENVGHGWATAKEIQIEEFSEWIGFAMQELGITPRQGMSQD